MTGWQPARVLYFGDHPYADLADLSMYHGWRTCAIIEELEEEIDKANHPDMKLKVNWSNELQKLLNTYQDCGDDPDCRTLLNEWKDELEQLRQVYLFYFHFSDYVSPFICLKTTTSLTFTLYATHIF